MATISTHVLDVSLGKPAAGLAVLLEQLDPNDSSAWHERGRGVTNGDGRIPALLESTRPLQAGTWRMTFQTGQYFARRSVASFYPHVQVTFTVNDASQHHHVPLLLSPFGYSTYRGT